MPIDAAPKGPARLAAIETETKALGFGMASDPLTGSFLRTLAASKPGGNLLELGTGTGVATSWLLEGMDRQSTLVSVDSDVNTVAVARRHLGDDARVTFIVADGGSFLMQANAEGRQFDLVFADAWPGKYSHLDEALALVARGGWYVVDDMLPHPNWPPEHQRRCDALLEVLWSTPRFHVAALEWSTGLIVAVRTG